jgi:hypothetical protein
MTKCAGRVAGIVMVLAKALPATRRYTIEPDVCLAAMTAHTPCVHIGILDTHIHRYASCATGVAGGARPVHEIVDVVVVQRCAEPSVEP